jgi:hypothetical protein
VGLVGAGAGTAPHATADGADIDAVAAGNATVGAGEGPSPTTAAENRRGRTDGPNMVGHCNKHKSRRMRRNHEGEKLTYVSKGHSSQNGNVQPLALTYVADVGGRPNVHRFERFHEFCGGHTQIHVAQPLGDFAKTLTTY